MTSEYRLGRPRFMDGNYLSLDRIDIVDTVVRNSAAIAAVMQSCRRHDIEAELAPVHLARERLVAEHSVADALAMRTAFERKEAERAVQARHSLNALDRQEARARRDERSAEEAARRQTQQAPPDPEAEERKLRIRKLEGDLAEMAARARLEANFLREIDNLEAEEREVHGEEVASRRFSALRARLGLSPETDSGRLYDPPGKPR